MIAECRIHGEKSHFFYVPSANGKICMGCMLEGFFSEDIVAEARKMYPQQFLEAKPPPPTERRCLTKREYRLAKENPVFAMAGTLDQVKVGSRVVLVEMEGLDPTGNSLITEVIAIEKTRQDRKNSWLGKIIVAKVSVRARLQFLEELEKAHPAFFDGDDYNLDGMLNWIFSYRNTVLQVEGYEAAGKEET